MSRPPLFATGIKIKNFRGYGEFTLSLPATPCAVLLSGPNGLGKTSLFEAVEWGLTGSVKRLDMVAGGRADPHDLARRAAGVEAVEVALAFRDKSGAEERVQRTQLVPPGDSVPNAHGTRVSAVAELLRSDEARWSVSGKNLAEYLHLTHLHAQVASLRLVTFSAKERWVRVSPLAGADRFERVRTNLTSSKSALTKLKDRRAEALREAIERRERWADLLRRLEQFQKLVATMRDVLAPRDVIRAVRELTKARHLNPGEWISEVEADVSSASEAIREARITIERGVADCNQKLHLLARLRVLPRQMADVTSQRSGLTTRAEAIAEEIARLKMSAEQLARRAAESAAVADEANRASKIAVARHERVTRTLRDRADLGRLDNELAVAEQQLRELDQMVEDARVELRRKRDEGGIREKLALDHESARRRLEEAELAAGALVELEALQKRVDTEQGRRDVLVEQQRQMVLAADALSADQRTLDESIVAADGALEDRRKTAAELQQALLAIAKHVTDNDANCPVCGTGFPHGKLRALARSSMEALNPDLAEGEARLASLEEHRALLRTRATTLAQDARKLAADLRALDESLGQLRGRVALLAKQPLLDQTPLDEARKRVALARTERQGEVQRLQRQLASAPPPEQLKKSISDAGAALDTLTRERSLIQERRLARQTRCQEVRARLAHSTAEYAELDVSTADLAVLGQSAALDASKAKEAFDLASDRFAEASAAESAERQTLAASNQELERVQGQIDAIGGSMDDMMKQWRAVPLPEPASDAALDVETDRFGQRRRDLEGALTELSNLSSALERWQQTTELQNLEAEVRRQQGGLEPEAYTRQLDAAVAEARTSAAAAQRARDAADQLSTTLGKITADFGERALRPFDELFRRYLRALIHDERFHTIQATYEPSARAAALRFRVDLGDSETDAEYILSEGQLGEVSLAAMLAASTTFPWSRWKALLLDDPTQYNDLIHATALFDVLRNLVRFAGYQIFVSTHDNEQAGFLRRKLDAVRIPWVDCRYVAHGPEGIMVDIRSSDDSESTPISSAS